MATMNMLAVGDIARKIAQAHALDQVAQQRLHRDVRQWADKGFLQVWGRGGNGKTSPRLHTYDQVYRAAFLDALMKRASLSDDQVFECLSVFDGQAVHKVSCGLRCFFIDRSKHDGVREFFICNTRDISESVLGESLANGWGVHVVDLNAVLGPVLETREATA